MRSAGISTPGPSFRRSLDGRNRSLPLTRDEAKPLYSPADQDSRNFKPSVLLCTSQHFQITITMEKSEWPLLSNSQRYSLISDNSASSSDDLSEPVQQKHPSRLSRKNVVYAFVALLSLINAVLLGLNIWGYIEFRRVPNYDHCMYT